MYTPTHEELIDMGFSPQEWEGNLYSYNFKALEYKTSIDPEGNTREPCWWLSSWYQRWYPRTKSDVETVIGCYEPS